MSVTRERLNPPRPEPAALDVPQPAFRLCTLRQLRRLERTDRMAQEQLPVPGELQVFLERSRSPKEVRQNYTYYKTVEDPDWQQKLFRTIEDICAGPAAELLQQLNITDIKQLSPTQAIQLCNGLVLTLKKYEIAAADGRRSAADTMTAAEVLLESQARSDDPTWEGLGVCRNYAGVVMAVYETLQAKQESATDQLKNLYCTYQSGYGHLPVRRDNLDPAHQPSSLSPHAWNGFFLVTQSDTAAISTDATFSQWDLDSGDVINSDVSQARAESLVYDSLTSINHSHQPERVLQTAHEFYGHHYWYAKVRSNLDEALTYLWRYVEGLRQAQRFDAFDPELLQEVALMYPRMIQKGWANVADTYSLAQLQHENHIQLPVQEYAEQQHAYFIRHLQALLHLAKQFPGVIDLNGVIGEYMAGLTSVQKSVDNTSLLPQLLLGLTAEDAAVVKEVLFDTAHRRPDFDRLVQKPNTRAFIRQTKPEWLRRFRPDNDLADLSELQFYIQHSTYLRQPVLRQLRQRDRHISSLKHLTVDDLPDIQQLVWTMLAERGVDQSIGFLAAVRQFDQWYTS